MSAVETKTLLSKYFEKVINLREQERKTELQCSEMEVCEMLSIMGLINIQNAIVLFFYLRGKLL